jgi:hypothetical protein
MATFKVRDLLINVISERPGGGVGLCSEDVSATAPTPITPYILVAANRPVLDHVQNVTKRLVDASDPDGDPVVNAIDQVALDIGRQVVVAAVQGGGALLPDPNCSGTSMETIPTPITPVVHKTTAVLQASHLPQLRVQLAAAIEATKAAEQALSPDTQQEIRMVEKKLEGALSELRDTAPR